MSTNKKRKVEGQEAPKPMSAISALAARRRAIEGSQPTTPEPEERPAGSNKNYFSLLSRTGKDSAPQSPSEKAVVKLKSKRGPNSPATAQVLEASSHVSNLTDNVSATYPSKLVQYSSFRLTKRNHRIKAEGVAELRLEDSERFLILGAFGIRVLRGEVTVIGATLKPSDTIHWIQATHCHAVPVIRTTENTGLEIHPDPTFKGLRQLGRLSPLYRKMWHESPDSATQKGTKEPTFRILCTSDDAPKRSIIQELVSLPEWNKKLASLVTTASKTTPMITLVCGPKSSGKSTFSKILTNRLLTECSSAQGEKSIMVMDLDPGQPGYAPAGTLSLTNITQPNLSSPFAHPGVNNDASQVIRCHALASVSPASDPVLFLDCAANLFQTYHETSADSPLIINTPGWILGTGLDLLVDIIARIKPDEVIYMSEEGPVETVEMLQSATSKEFTTLPSQQSEFTSRTAAHLRAMQMMSYFHIQESAAATSRLRWNPSPLSMKPPLLIPYSTHCRGILGILSYDYQSPAELLAETINGMVLAAVEIEDSRAFRELGNKVPKVEGNNAMEVDNRDKESTGPQVLTTPEGIPFIPNYDDIALDPAHCRTIGLVLLRGIDTKEQTLQVITPISPEQISDIKSLGREIVLVHGKFDAPSWAYTEDLYARTEQDGGDDRRIEIMDEDTSEDDSEAEPEDVERVSDVKAIPWVEVLKGNEKRPVGSRVWRVRRDLGRNVAE